MPIVERAGLDDLGDDVKRAEEHGAAEADPQRPGHDAGKECAGAALLDDGAERGEDPRIDRLASGVRLNEIPYIPWLA